VRDALVDRMRDTPEIDFATELRPEEVSRRAAAAGVPVYPTGIEHGTVTLKVGDLIAEVTTLREDVETDGRHAKVKFGKDWTRDAERRDFTLNALYARADGTLFDPLGGADDCIAGYVRFIGDADQRIAEDRLRVYRFFRFTASHGHEKFDRSGLEAVTRAAGSLDGLSAERVGSEMRRMLDLPRVGTTLGAMRREFAAHRDRDAAFVHRPPEDRRADRAEPRRHPRGVHRRGVGPEVARRAPGTRQRALAELPPGRRVLSCQGRKPRCRPASS